MKNLPALLFLCVLILTSCKTDTKIPIEESKQFDYRAYLLRNNNNVPFIPIDIDQPQDSLFKLVNIHTKKDCTDFLRFNTVVENDTITVLNQQNCNMFCGLYFEYSIYVFPEEIIWGENGNMSLSEIKSDFLKHMEEYNDLYSYSNDIKFSITNYSDNLLLTRIIYYKVINTYLEFMSQIADNKYSKPLEELTIYQLDQLKKHYQLTLSFREFPPEPQIMKDPN
ncbi:hypothetical protein [Nonlabens sp.]|uniref:hypothetical protein n=1 Tax=Nonlabens sp. TaxID=1888209 RepID=UPI003264C575